MRWGFARRFWPQPGALCQPGAIGYDPGVPILSILAAATLAAGAVEAPLVIDLTVPTPCAEADEAAMNGEIVVCSEKDRQALRLSNAHRPPAKPVPKAEVQVTEGVALGLETESADLGMARSQRAMVRLKIKL